MNLTRTRVLRALAIPAVATALVVGLSACSSGSDSGMTVVKIGSTNQDPHWQVFKDEAAKEGIDLQITSFTDFNQPNRALSQKQVDVNQFQHIKYLGTYNVQNNDTLVPIGSTQIFPLGLYSLKHSSVGEFPDGAQIAIPNDPTNQGRALFVLQSAGLIKLKDGTGTNPTPSDIDEGSSKAKVTAVDAAQTAMSLQSVDGSVINNTFVARANLDASKAIFKDDPNDPNAEQYINVFAVREADKDNPTYQKLVEIYHRPDVQAAVNEEEKGSNVEVQRPQAELQQILDRVEDNVRNNK